MIEVKKAEMVVKITAYTEKQGDARVVYFRSGMPVESVIKWKWYFSYLTALIKVKHPRWSVELTIVNQELKFGEEYKKEKIQNLIKNCKAKITQISREVVIEDMFGLNEQEKQDRLKRYKERLKKLESGEYDGYIPPEFINDIKKYI